MVLQRRVEQQARHVGVLLAAIQNAFGNADEHFAIRAASTQVVANHSGAPGSAAFAINDGPVQIFFCGEMTKDNGFIDARIFSDAARCGATESKPRKQFHRYIQDLLAPVW